MYFLSQFTFFLCDDITTLLLGYSVPSSVLCDRAVYFCIVLQVKSFQPFPNISISSFIEEEMTYNRSQESYLCFALNEGILWRSTFGTIIAYTYIL
jgi:hypothetical protein